MPTRPLKTAGSRASRKRADRITAVLGGADTPMRRFGPLYWGPRRLSWWIGALFMVGSACFMAGPLVGAIGAAETAGVIYFTGSIFFTSAAYLQYLEAVNAPESEDEIDNERDASSRRVRLLRLQPHRIEWLSTTVQLAGTLFFNLSTFSAMQDSFSLTRQERLVWAPDVFGSACFLVASCLAFAEVRRAWGRRPRRDIGWGITVLNLVGSVAFGVSAIASYIVPDTGELLNAAASSAWTFSGAACFFAGAYLLWPESARAGEAGSAPHDGSA